MKNEMPKSSNVVWNTSSVSLAAREKKLKYTIHVFWFTGLSGAGKSTLTVNLERLLFEKGIMVARLDGDNIRYGLNGDLGFSEDDRTENIRRIGHVSKLFYDHGIITLCSFVSPFRKDRDFVRKLFPTGRFHEIYTACTIAECIKRDPKGLYKKALAGIIQGYTGISSPYEEPLAPELVLHTDENSLENNIESIYAYIIDTIIQTGKER